MAPLEMVVGLVQESCHAAGGLISLVLSLLLQLDQAYLSTETTYNLATWETILRRAQTKGLTLGIRTAYDRMMSAVDASDPITQAIVRDLLLTGES